MGQEYIEARFPIKCKGRSPSMEEILEDAVDVMVLVSQCPDNYQSISLHVEGCPHNGGSHGGRCDASGYKGVSCPYSIDLPYALDWMVRLR